MSDSATIQKLIFISHKSTDSELASALREALRSAMENVSFFLSEEIEKGNDWRSEIENKLREASCLVLIYTSPTYYWSWCLYEAILFDEIVSRPDPKSRKLYCIHYSGSNPPDPLQRFQTVSATKGDLTTWLENFYRATGQQKAFESLEAMASNLESVLRTKMPRSYSTNHLRPSIQIKPAWLQGDNLTPNWSQRESIPKTLPLGLSEAWTDDISAIQLGFAGKPSPMKLIDFLTRLDAEKTGGEPAWISPFLKSLQTALEGQIKDQNVVSFRSMTGGILTPIIESITRSNDGIECTCRVVFSDAFGMSPVSSSSELQQHANGLRVAVRIRIEVLDRYKGRMAESLRLSRSIDPQLSKLHPPGSQLLGTLKAILREAEMHGYDLTATAPTLFVGENQIRYEKLRSAFNSNLIDLKRTASEEDQQPDGTYVETEKLLNVLQQLNSEYISIAGPYFLNIIDASDSGGNSAFVQVQ